MKFRLYVISCGLVTLQLCADTTWTNGGVTGLWVTAGNWTSGLPGITDTALFPLANQGAISTTGALCSAATLSFTGGTYTISGLGSINLYTSIIVSNSANPTISCPLILNGASSISIQALNPITISGAITGTAGTNGLILSGAETITFSSTSNTYSGTTFITGGSELTSIGANSFSSSSIINIDGLSSFTLVGATNSVASINGTGAVNLSGTLGDTLTLVSASGSFLGNIYDNGAGTGIAITAGTLSIGSGVIQYSGPTTINGGTLTLTGSNTLPTIAGAGTINLSGLSVALTIGTSTPQTFPGQITGTGGIIDTGSGAITFSGTNSYSGSTQIQLGSLIAGSTSAFSPSSVIQLSSGTSLSLVTFANSIANLNGPVGSTVSLGTGVLSIVGSGTGLYSGTFTGTGGLTMAGTGSLTVVTPGALASGAPLVVNSGTLNLSDSNTTSALSGLGGTLAIASSSVLTINGSSGAFSGSISGLGGIAVTNSATLTLNGANNTYSGPTSLIGSATLNASASTANTLSSGSDITIAASATLALNGQDNAVPSIAGSGHVNLGAGTLSLTASSTTFSGNIFGTGGLSINALGTFTLNSTGINLYSGLTTLSNLGTLVANAAGAFSPNSTVYLQNNGELSLNGFDNTIQNLKGDAGGIVSLSTNTLTFGADNASWAFAGQITSGIGGGLTKNGTGTFTLTGTTNNYLGTTTVNSSGSFQAGATNSFSAYSDFLLNGTSTLDLNGWDNTISDLNGGSGTFVLLTPGTDSGTLTIDGGIGTYNGSISAGGGLTLTNGSTFTLTSTLNDYSGPTLVTDSSILISGGTGSSFSSSSAMQLTNSGKLQLNGNVESIPSLNGDSTAIIELGAGASASLEITGSANSLYAGAITSPVAPNGAIEKSGTGTLVLSGSGLNTYYGYTVLNNGTLKAGAINAFSPNSVMSFVDASSGTTLDLNGYANTIAAILGDTNVDTQILLTNKAILTFGNQDNTAYYGAISGTGGIELIAGPIFFLYGQNTYSGHTVISLGTIAAGVANTFSPDSLIEIDASGILALRGFDNTIANLSGAGSVILNSALSSNTLTLGRDDQSLTFSGNITETAASGAITKVGAGTLTLKGTGSNYSGLTTISAGSIKAGLDDVFSHLSEVVVNGSSLNINSKTCTIANLSGSGGSVLLGIGSLTFGNANSRSYSGSILGTNSITGAITKVGAGTFTLNGTNNSYGGTTTLSGGVWQAGAINAFSKNSTINLAAGTTVDLNGNSNIIGGLGGTSGTVNLNGGALTTGFNNTSSSYSGTIIGGGGLIKVGEGTLTLGASNSYTGGTQINGGAISISNDNRIGNVNGGLTLNGGKLIVTNSSQANRAIVLSSLGGTIETQNVFIISGNISGTGSLTKLGSSYLVLDNPNNIYTGATIINDGYLQAANNDVFSPTSEVLLASSGSSVLDLNSYSNTIGNLSGAGIVAATFGTLTLGNANSTVFSGNIEYLDYLIKNGTGLLDLTGTNTTHFGTVVNAGTVAINGTTTSPITVNANGTLKGAGLIVGNVNCYGTTAPGNSIDTLTITGNHEFFAGSNFEVEVDPLIADNLTTSGTTTIDPGSSITVIPYRGFYNSTIPYEIITATGGLSGVFDTVIFSSNRATAELEYFPNKLILHLSMRGFTDVAIGWNAKNVAKVLDGITQIDPPGWAATLDNLFGLSELEFNVALNEIVPAELKGLSIIQQNNAVRVQNGISLRFQNLLDKMNCPPLKGCPVNKSRAYVWVDGFNSRLRQSSNFIDTNPQVGYHSSTGGGAIGLDVNFLKFGYVGIMGAGTYSDVQWVNNQGKGHINSGYVGIYGSAIGDKKFINLSLLGSVNKYGAARKIIYSGENAQAHSTHNGLQLLSHLDAGLNLDCKWFTLRPFESLEYIIQHEKNFSEEGAGVLNLDIQKTNPQIFRNELGINFARCFNISKKSRLLADLKLSWVNESRLKGTLFTSSFTSFDYLTFQTAGYYPNRNFFAPGATLTANFANDTAYITVTYDAEIGHHYLDQRTGAQFGFRF